MKATTIIRFIAVVFTSLFVSVAINLALPVNPYWLAGGLVAVYIVQMIGFRFLKAEAPRFLLMALTAFSCADAVGTAPATYTVAGNCLEEKTGIIGMFIVKKGFNLNTVIDQTTYDAAKTAKDIIPVKDLSAFWPTATPVYSPTTGNRPDRLSRIDFEMPFEYEGVTANIPFQNAMNNSRNLGVIFVTETYQCYAALDRDLEPILATFFAAPAGEQTFNEPVKMKGTVKWKGPDLMYNLDLFTKAIVRPDFQA